MKLTSLLLLLMPTLVFAVPSTKPSALAITDEVETQKILEKQTALAHQRKQYQTLIRFLSLPQSDNSLELARGLLTELNNYPLASDAAWQILKNTATLDFAQIIAYQAKYPATTATVQLKNQWVSQQIQQENWSAILANRAQLPNNTASSCALLLAEYKNSLATTQPASKEKTQQWANNVQKIWLNGSNLPKYCSPLFDAWTQQGYQTPKLVQQRAIFALEQNNINLIKQLSKTTGDKKLKEWLNNLVIFSTKPYFTQSDSLFFINKLNPKNDIDKRILVTLFPAFVKTLNDKNIENPQTPFKRYADWAIRFQLTSAQQKQWLITFLKQIFDSPLPDIQQWRDKQLMELKNDTLSERRIRMAIREKQDIAPWLALLSSKAQQKEEWQYWIAQQLKSQGNHTEARKILQKLTALRSFYGLLAAQDLGVDYSPMMQQITPNPQMLSDTAIQTALAQIAEWRYWQENQQALQVWSTLLSAVSFEKKLQLAHYAIEQQWFDLAVEATIQAKAWGYITLRLPNAYQNWFDLMLKNKKIDRTFAMAIARQESAWKHYVSSSANAMGLMQLLPSTAQQTAKAFNLPYKNSQQLFEPFDNIMLGTAHLQQLYDKYGDNRILIAAAYNAGAMRVDQWLQKANGQLSMAEFVASIPFYETRGYVQNVIVYAFYYQMLQQKAVQKFTESEYNRTY